MGSRPPDRRRTARPPNQSGSISLLYDLTRRARLAYAAWFVLLAGIDEDGIYRDLDCAAELFYAAAMA
ncbi:MAG: hypothetical protein NVS3B5_03390 [Sphingomicrobium sp.]